MSIIKSLLLNVPSLQLCILTSFIKVEESSEKNVKSLKDCLLVSIYPHTHHLHSFGALRRAQKPDCNLESKS